MDLNVRAFRVVQAALSDTPTTTETARTVASRKGGLRGGEARAHALSAKRRSEIARKASRARWANKRGTGR